MLDRRGLINQGLFETLLKKSPARHADIQKVADLWSFQLSTDLVGEHPGPRGFKRVTPSQDAGSALPKRFFMGHPPSWSDLRLDVDVRRRIDYGNNFIQYDEFLANVISEAIAPGPLILFGEGGSGKTTFLRRLMYDIAGHGHAALRHVTDANFDIDEVVRLTADLPKPVFVFFDDAQYQAARIFALSRELSYSGNTTFIIGAARRNEWNSAIAHLRGAKSYESAFLPRLDAYEARQLIGRLKKHDALGSLQDLSEDQQLDALTVKANNQLLVGLLEATQGKRFRDIVIDEFHGIVGTRASALYMAVCIFSGLGFRTPDKVALLISEADSRFSFESDVFPSLELVVSYEDTPLGFDLLPRHRIIANELVQHLCRTPGAHFDACLSALGKMANVRRPVKRVQNFAARLGPKILKRNLISNPEDAKKLVEFLLSAGVGDYRYGAETRRRKHRLVRQAPTSRRTRRYEQFYQVFEMAHPNQNQFRSCVPIIRQFLGDEEAIALISEALALKPQWNHLRFDWALIEYERNNIEASERIISEVLRRQGTTDDEITLPVALAVDIATHRARTDAETALAYLAMARPNLHRGMQDPKLYFLYVARQFEAIGNIAAAIDSLKEGLDFISGPKWAIESCERVLAHYLAQHRPAEFLSWAEKHTPRNGEVPYYLTRCHVERAVAIRDAAGVKEIWATTIRGREAVSDVARQSLDQEGSEVLDFVVGAVGLDGLADDVLSAIIERAAQINDFARLSELAQKSARITFLLRNSAKDAAAAGNAEKFRLYSSAAGGETSQDDVLLLILTSALDACDEQGILSFLEQLRGVPTLPLSTAKKLLHRAIGRQREDVAAAVLSKVDNGKKLSFEVVQIHLKTGSLSVLGIVDRLFDRPALPSWAVMLLLHSALVANDLKTALEVCGRTNNLPQVFSMLRKRLKVVGQEQEAFLERLSASLGTASKA
ncbi:P-loop NTPase [Corallococcus sp. M7]